MFVGAYAKIQNVQRFSSFYAIYLILSLEMSDEPQRTLSLSERRGNACIHYPERRKSRRFPRYTSSAIEDILLGQSKYIFSENGMVSSNCQKFKFREFLTHHFVFV